MVQWDKNDQVPNCRLFQNIIEEGIKELKKQEGNKCFLDLRLVWFKPCSVHVCYLTQRSDTSIQYMCKWADINRQTKRLTDRWFQRLTDNYGLSSSRQTEGHTQAACL